MTTTYRYNREERSKPAADRPHHCDPTIGSLRVVLAVKNFSKISGVCHIGLGVTALCTQKVLRRNGIHTEVWATQTTKDLEDRLAAEAYKGTKPITHVIISAPSWVQPDDFCRLAFQYMDTEFVQLNHSGCAYLSIDKFGIRNIRQVIDLELSAPNIRAAANNQRLAKWLTDAFGFEALFLPNLYDTDSFVNPVKPRPIGDTIRIGCFGASRPWKNQLTAAEGAVQFARRLGMNLEFYVNSKRPDGGERMIEARAELFDHLPGCKLVDVPWERWPRFRDIIGTMHLLYQPSFDETFNVVTADGIAEGVPSVTTSAIEWTPERWWCKPEDPSSIVEVSMALLHNHNAVHEARILLTKYVAHGVGYWMDYLLHRKQITPQ